MDRPTLAVTALARFIRNLLERWLGRYYEGPSAPPRLGQEVRLFAALHPDASVDDWKAFATALAEQAYRDAFTRGLEWNERLWPGPSVDPDELALELQRHAWSLPEERLARIEAQPRPIAGMSAHDAAVLQHSLARAGARIVPLPSPPKR